MSMKIMIHLLFIKHYINFHERIILLLVCIYTKRLIFTLVRSLFQIEKALNSCMFISVFSKGAL